MKFYGHANMQKNQLQNAALETLQYFPTAPVVGQIAFVNSIVYICVNADSPPVWVPLTREITSYVHTQNTPSDEWVVPHNLNTTGINVQVYDGTNRLIIPDEVLVSDQNNAVVYFNTAVTGKAVVVTGHVDGTVRPTYAYTFYQSSANTVWTIGHSLGYNPIVRVFVGTNEVQPESISHPDANTTIVTFLTAQAGYAQLI